MQRKLAIGNNAELAGDVEMGAQRARRAFLYRVGTVALLPLVLAGLYVLAMQLWGYFRYDDTKFTPVYRETYHSPGMVARELEAALQNGDRAAFADLTGLRSNPSIQPNPSLVLALLFEVDQGDYFHYLYFDTDTFERQTHYVKEVDGRWVASPDDAFFYYDSGQWLRAFVPILGSWWLIVLVYLAARYLFNVAARTRAGMGM